MQSRKIHVVLSGGVGSRLWPLSRNKRPKQYIPLVRDKSLFQLSVQLNQDLTDECLVVGNASNFQHSRNHLEQIDIHEYREIIEALPRNTAAAIAFAALSVSPDDVLLVTPSDHVIQNKDAYSLAVKRAFELAEEGYLVTFGIKPHKPETGYGYIEYEGEDVLSFREKPSLNQAQQYLASNRFVWNSGIFCFKASVYLDELIHLSPEVYEASAAVFEGSDDAFLDEELSKKVPPISVDYAVMEKSEKIKVVAANFEWSDLGSFESLFDYFSSNGEGRIISGNNLVIGTDMHIECPGLHDNIIVVTDDAMLIVPKDDSQEVKNIYQRLEREKPNLI
jgi:mannose-1-phosphate guanylyltransferase